MRGEAIGNYSVDANVESWAMRLQAKFLLWQRNESFISLASRVSIYLDVLQAPPPSISMMLPRLTFCYHPLSSSRDLPRVPLIP